MLDCDLAIFYGYEVKALNQQVKRNIERFPEDFRFKTTKEDIRMIREQISYQEKQGITTRSQFVTLYEENIKGKNIKYNPYAFSEQGIYTLASVLKGDLAVQQSIYIMRANQKRYSIAEHPVRMQGKNCVLLMLSWTQI